MREKTPQSHSELGIKLVAKKEGNRGPLGPPCPLGPGEDGEILARGGCVPESQAGGVGRGQAGTCAAGLF